MRIKNQKVEELVTGTKVLPVINDIKMRYYSLLFILSILFCFSSFEAKAQQKDTLYYKLDSTINNYGKFSLERQVTMETTRNVFLYSFTIECDCSVPGVNSLSFYGHDNPETGEIFDPIREIDDKAFNDLNFIKFDDLLVLLKKFDYEFTSKYKLYFVESKGKKHTLYDVRFASTFGTE